MLALGRPAMAGDLAEPLPANKSLRDLIEVHRENLKRDRELQREVAVRAEEDATGSVLPGDQGADQTRGLTYAEQMQRQIASLATAPDRYRQVIDRAYQHVIRRPAYPEEHDYWKTRGTLPYVVLVGAIENWAQRNQPGLMVTTGTPSISVNSRFLTTLRLSLPIANEARTLLGLPVWTDVGRQHSPGNHVVAVGAADIASVGGVHFLLAGGGPLAGR